MALKTLESRRCWVVAESFGRIFYRNSLNVGLPGVKCSDIVKKVQQGSLIQINLKEGLFFLSSSRKNLIN